MHPRPDQRSWGPGGKGSRRRSGTETGRVDATRIGRHVFASCAFQRCERRKHRSWILVHRILFRRNVPHEIRQKPLISSEYRNIGISKHDRGIHEGSHAAGPAWAAGSSIDRKTPHSCFDSANFRSRRFSPLPSRHRRFCSSTRSPRGRFRNGTYLRPACISPPPSV